MRLSIVTTMYYSAPYLEEFHRRISAAALQITDDYEIIFVNDGSPDNALELVMKLYEQDPKVKVIDLSRNFGHHKAIMAGLAHTKGEFVFLIDVDLEEDPEWLPDFFQHLQQEHCDVVYGVQSFRKGGWFERCSGRIAYALFNLLCDIKTPKNLTTARIMTRRYIDALLLHQERLLVFSGLCEITGFRQCPQNIFKAATSPTTYTFSKKISSFINMVTSFSSAPLKFIFYIGLLISFFSGLLGCKLIIQKLFFSKILDGWSSIMVSIWFLGGITVLFLGLIGVYLSKIFIEIKQRPNVIIRETFERESQ